MKALVQSYNANTHKGVLLALVPFQELYYKAQFSHKTNPGEDPYETEYEIANNDMYQRELNITHLKEVRQYLYETISSDINNNVYSALFPTSMLIAYTDDNVDNTLANRYEIEIDLPTKFYIVDGQHRLAAMKSLYDDVKDKEDEKSRNIATYIKKYTFNCSILINYDLWEQARIFADVNFNQKRVNKSLYYEIYGSQYYENSSDWGKNYLYVAHNLVEFMNTFETSPLKGGIRMLGTGQGFVSQAFMVEALLKSISMPRGIWFFDHTGIITKETYRHMSTELISFFIVIRNTFEDLWPINGKHRSILLKTTGIGALIRLMAYLHKLLNEETIDELKRNTDITRKSERYMKEILPYIKKLVPHKDKLFGLNGDFSGTGGRGYEMKLYKRMREISCGIPIEE